jgi:hypothetical protein
MSLHTRANGAGYFASLAGTQLDPSVANAIDAEFNAFASTVNAIDNANIANTPQIDGGKVDFSGAGYLLLTGGTLSGNLGYDFEGIWNTYRDSGNAQVREYNGSDGALWGISYNTEFSAGVWQGRDVTGICAVLKIESDGFHYYHAVSAGNGVVPSWTELFHMNLSGVMEVGVPNADTITEAMIDWPNSGGIGQVNLFYTEFTETSTSWQSKGVTILYVPDSASNFSYVARIYRGSATSTDFRIVSGAVNGDTLNSTAASYEILTGNLDVSTFQDTWIPIEVFMKIGPSGTGYCQGIAGLFI